MELLQEISKLEESALESLRQVATLAAAQAWHTQQMGAKSRLQGLLGQMRALAPADRPAVGAAGNRVKQALAEAYAAKQEGLQAAALEEQLRATALDVTAPGRAMPLGKLHPATQILLEVQAIWAEMGFQIFRSQSVETDEFNFQLLNFPVGHPARDMQDTFHTTIPDVILRTHTSPGQIRAMRAFCPEPIRVILPGMCYRYEQITTRSEVQFHQVEGLAVGEGITFSNLKGTLTDFARRLFGESVQTRFRASYFPFTEPSAEMDVECFLCNGRGCPVCKQSGWLEILGCGMVHPVVLQNGGYDPERVTGFAFGMGPERIAMLRYGIDDIRNFWGNDTRFLRQF